MIGQAVFLAADVSGAAIAGWRVRDAAFLRGRRDATRAAVWSGLSLLAYTALCVWLGFGWTAQGIAAAAAFPFLIPLRRRHG